MPAGEIDPASLRLRRALIDPNVGIVDRAMLDCAAHMILYIDDAAAVQRIAVQHLVGRYRAARSDLGLGSPSDRIYKATASESDPSYDVPDMVGRELPNLERGIQVVWHSDRAVALDFTSEPALDRLRPTMAALGTSTKLARRLEFAGTAFGIVCIDRSEDTRVWTSAEQRYLDQFVVAFLSPILAESGSAGLRRGTGRLTPAERAVARLAMGGLSYKEIAAALGKSPNTVDNQLRQMRAKLAVRNQVELVRACMDLGG